MINSTFFLERYCLSKGAILIAALLVPFMRIDAAEFFCPSGNVTCLIAAINEANGSPGEHVINLEPGSYTLQSPNRLPTITSPIRIQASAEDLPTVIERDPNPPLFTVFSVSASGELHLDGITVQTAGGHVVFGAFVAAITNGGVTSFHNSIIRELSADFGTIRNSGTLHVIRSIIRGNQGGHEAGGIVNNEGGNLLVENSTIDDNHSQGAGGIFNRGSLVVRNSAIVFNSTDCCQAGGGIANIGSAEIFNTTIAKNQAGGFFFREEGAGGGIWNGLTGDVSIINSTIRENETGFLSTVAPGGGIANDGGTVRVQNTIVAGNSINSALAAGQDCFGVITSLGNNIVGDPSGCDINLQPSDLTGAPGLGPLVEFGEDDSPGKAFYPVLTGSVVINRANPAACPKKDQLGNPRVGTCDIGAVEFQGRMLVSVDVRPRSDANRINPHSSHNINVAVFSGKGFDATTLDPNTVRFGATGTEAAPIHVARRDVDGDGRQDLIVRFQIQESGIECGDTSATVSGQTSSGLAIVGSSPIRTTGCKEPNENVASRVR